MLQNSKPIPPEKLVELQKLIDSAKWRATKVYPEHMAHSYVLKVDQPQIYAEIHQAIAEYGFDSKFYNATYRYVIIGEHKYWDFESLTNREVIEKSEARFGKPELGG